ncbi:DUF1488 family protein [Janthinobacterium aquaticum]|uniref:DUF1488 family protein n=1 Tax=Janthinobacterium sp. FT58W TaxID=2654254 RepID=UPI0012642004|nr:DUF1488 family protein [Janthinobacterium sp. FT58W]KAB8041623.1 DUF1488 family protein [Janthinobacterium sp. FT58W]
MPYEIVRDSIRLDAAEGAVTFHLAVFGADKTCRVTATALQCLGAGEAPGEPLQIFELHQLRIAQRAFACLSRDLLLPGITLRALDF